MPGADIITCFLDISKYLHWFKLNIPLFQLLLNLKSLTNFFYGRFVQNIQHNPDASKLLYLFNRMLHSVIFVLSFILEYDVPHTLPQVLLS